MSHLEGRINISFRIQPAMEPEGPERPADQVIELTERTGDETSTGDKDASLQKKRNPQRQQSSEDEIDLDMVFQSKGRVQKPQLRKNSAKGAGGVPPFSVNFFPLTFWPAVVR